MKKYQDKNGFSPTGKIDAGSLNKLGLGSDTGARALQCRLHLLRSRQTIRTASNDYLRIRVAHLCARDW